MGPRNSSTIALPNAQLLCTLLGSSMCAANDRATAQGRQVGSDGDDAVSRSGANTRPLTQATLIPQSLQFVQEWSLLVALESDELVIREFNKWIHKSACWLYAWQRDVCIAGPAPDPNAPCRELSIDNMKICSQLRPASRTHRWVFTQSTASSRHERDLVFTACMNPMGHRTSQWLFIVSCTTIHSLVPACSAIISLDVCTPAAKSCK